MALDGFSLRSVGLGQDQTSAQMAMNTERAVLQGQAPKGVETLANAGANKAVTLDEGGGKEKDNKKKKNKQNEALQSDSEVDAAYTLDADMPQLRGLDFYTRFSEKLAIRLNRKTEVIELYDKESKKTIESITAIELMKLVEKLTISSGILVNRKI